jgi:activator of 2-hydroxyglutaryl-CoA dehydratase/predicted nucleotide-binding protein (sugar kinase/HSP70/actin superfamily)
MSRLRFANQVVGKITRLKSMITQMDKKYHNSKLLFIGLDVGSTTVKAVVMDQSNAILWKKYCRHLAKQPEVVREFLDEIETRFPGRRLTVFTTGNGGRAIAPYLNARQIQEVNAVTLAVEKRYPQAGSVVELGGQDAKIILWKRDATGRKNTLSFMNDKCAGGTGATLDKVFTKIGLSLSKIVEITAEETPLHNIAAKCGVFAETDVVGLMKAGIKEEEIAVSLIHAIVKQNIEVLLRGNVLKTDVLLLGGPHYYFKAFETLWRREIPEIWRLHRFTPPKRPLDKMIYVPEDARYFAAIGAVYFGRESEMHLSDQHDGEHNPDRTYPGPDSLTYYIEEGKQAQLISMGEVKPGLVQSDEERRDFEKRFAIPAFEAPPLAPGSIVKCHLGVDGGSTSTKLVLIDPDGALLYKDYILSKGNPIVDVRNMLATLNKWRYRNRVELEICSSGVTGYAAAILEQAFGFDVSIVETVAHLRSAQQFCGNVDIICDVGGQDIKVLFMKHNRVVDIKLNTQCSAGNGYFLQNMAEQFGIPMKEYAEAAFSVDKAPSFNYGCAVFMEQDKVNFQQLGWTKEEIMAGLALVLPLNIWNYVVQETNLRRLGRRFLLQGGTQKNLAAVKAQVDFIENKVPGADVMVHPHADIAGAIGAALESVSTGAARKSTFIGIQRGTRITFSAKNNKSTECRFCANRCKRSFIDIAAPGKKTVRYISGYGCDKGQAENLSEMRERQAVKATKRDAFPNLVAEASLRAFDTYRFDEMPDELIVAERRQEREKMVVGIPRLLNMFLYAPFFSTYFRALGVGEVVYSDNTSVKLWREGNKWGAIDPCFPAKVAPAHIYNLLTRDNVTHICFPMITHMDNVVQNSLGETACVIQMATPEVVEAAFTKTRNQFAEYGKVYLKPLLRMDHPKEAFGKLLEYFGPLLGVTREENEWAAQQGFAAMDTYLADLRAKGAALINRLVETDRIGILFLGKPYHHDPGLNHGIFDAFQERGFPILIAESLPITRQFLDPLFPEATKERDQAPFDISDVWQRGFNRSTNTKIWAAKIAARHPNLAVIDMSSFKCGHDAPTYSYIDNILDASETPHFLFHDIDQNRPDSTFKIRIESIDYFLKKEEERLKEKISALTG